jgi:ribosomal protein L7/L12
MSDLSSVEAELEQMRARCRSIEAQLAVLSNKVGVPYVNPSASVPPEVAELAKAGKRLEAMKRYRELTNATAEEARQVVQSV